MTPAGRLQSHLKHIVQQSGGQYRKVRWEGRRGCPDCFVWWTWPHIAFIEIKAPGDRYSKLQEREVERLRRAGIPVYTVSAIEGIDFVVSEIRG